MEAALGDQEWRHIGAGGLVREYFVLLGMGVEGEDGLLDEGGVDELGLSLVDLDGPFGQISDLGRVGNQLKLSVTD